MAEIDVNCPYCGEQAKAPAKCAGKSAACPSCGKQIEIPAVSPTPQPSLLKRPASSAAPTPCQPQSQPERIAVVLTDIKMPFSSMVVFMIKWAFASIPAGIIFGIIVAILGFIASAVFMGGCAALMMGVK